MWFKKKSVLLAEGNYNTEKSADNTTDLRTTYKFYNNSSISNSGLPSAADANKYFYLPALGYYRAGLLNSVGLNGYYWSSSSLPWNSGYAYGLSFHSGNVSVGNLIGLRLSGFRVEALQ